MLGLTLGDEVFDGGAYDGVLDATFGMSLVEGGGDLDGGAWFALVSEVLADQFDQRGLFRW
ncbi:hypothetical protein [Streptomyces humi]|uniref:hypothetical protein n=1 Tax=Streptomyces humi TaxID=1428620 RepID=UPI0006289B28|nr:hypothetical protein [Streptomyces humi]